jgi:hypothetical protein
MIKEFLLILGLIARTKRMLDVLVGYSFVISASLVSFAHFTIVNKSIATITAFIDFERRWEKGNRT